VSERLAFELPDELVDVVAERAAEKVLAKLRDLEHAQQAAAPYLTVEQYARKHHATPAAVRARIRRGTLHGLKPPGAREWLIPNGVDRAAATVSRAQTSAPATNERPGA
jgi:hypothetical protein